MKVAQAVTLFPGGRTAQSFSVDRIDPAKGYTDDNIQPMLYGANSSASDKVKCRACIWGLTAEWKIYTLSLAEETPF